LLTVTPIAFSGITWHWCKAVAPERAALELRKAVDSASKKANREREVARRPTYLANITAAANVLRVHNITAAKNALDASPVPFFRSSPFSGRATIFHESCEFYTSEPLHLSLSFLITSRLSGP
jgi:hypothetical protein